MRERKKEREGSQYNLEKARKRKRSGKERRGDQKVGKRAGGIARIRDTHTHKMVSRTKHT